MKSRGLFASLGLLAVSSLVLVLAACGGGGSSNNSSSKTTTPSSSSGGNTNAGTGSDQQYVAAVCKAMMKFQDSVSKVTADPSKLTNASDISKAFSGPFDQLISDMKGAKPPKDIKSYHDQVVAQLSKANDSLKNGGDINSLSSLGDLPSPPQAVQDRLQKVADSDPDCQTAGINFTVRARSERSGSPPLRNASVM